MTKEEVIKWFRESPFYHKDHVPFNMAIEALKHDPCDDIAAFKEDVLDAISRIGLWKSDTKEVQAVAECLRAVEKLQPKTRKARTEESKTGHWVEEIINIGSRKVFCSECGCSAPFEYVSSGDVYSASGYGVINKTKFCPNCGKRMVDPKEKNAIEQLQPKQETKTGHWNIPFLIHKEMEIPIYEAQKAYEVAIDYLRSQAHVRG